MTNEIKWKEITWEFSDKQLEAFDILEDKETTEVFFGGGAGGGKSRLCVSWLIYSCLKYPGIRCAMGRAHLSDLKKSTLLTFFEVCKDWGLIKDKHYIYNDHKNKITWNNGSEIYLKDMFAYPSDPEFDSLGSTEYTFGFIDEVSEVTEKAKEVLASRMRFKLDKYDLIPKNLYASNPAKNWAYSKFYKPNRDKTLPKYRKFIQALAKDNPWCPKHYIENLKKLNEKSKQRLLFGNWEYSDDPSKIFEYEKILDFFTNNAVRGRRYCIIDVAGRGRDKTVIGIWDGLFLEKVIEMENISNTELDEILIKEKVPRSNCLADEDGVGFGLVKDLPGIRGFVNNATATQNYIRFDKTTINYANLKTQCWFELANHIDKGMVGCYRKIPIEFKEKIIEDLEQIKQKDMDKDTKLRIISKDEIKENLSGRSPDYGDMIMMRMFFELRMRRKAGISMGRRRVGI